ncbi:TetR/AcrR family transcriptional regulator [Amycolatopsis minnesotensis]|uniref:TetR/AcrR family transcriptional regulator n=1 Tax=Amycolatopsis minnesotensis TaxID=337894 RepID=A0ABN2Q3E3_9PSEU
MPTDARAALLATAVDELAETGVGDRSLRALATDLGTSHRMLIYHFGSKEGLLAEVAREVERRMRETLRALELDSDLPADRIALRFWHALTDPALRASERLFFELYGQALQGRAGTTGLLDGIIDDWLGPVSELLRRLGVEEHALRAHARLGLATARGLLLDLVTTGDTEGVREAMEVFVAGYPRPRSQRTHSLRQADCQGAGAD